MADMKDALMGNIGDYLKLQGQGSWNPVYTKGENGVRQRGFNFSGNAQANIPIDPLLEDAMLRLSAGGYRYGGDVKLPQRLQEMGAPDYIAYGDTALTNLGIGMTKDGYYGDIAYNPQSEDISAGFAKDGFSADLGYNRDTKNKSLMARYKVNF